MSVYPARLTGIPSEFEPFCTGHQLGIVAHLRTAPKPRNRRCRS